MEVNVAVSPLSEAYYVAHLDQGCGLYRRVGAVSAGANLVSRKLRESSRLGKAVNVPIVDLEATRRSGF
jgi:hypothetical protein